MTYEEFKNEGIMLLSNCDKINKIEKNYCELPITVFKINELDIEYFNTLVDWLHASGMSKIIRTKKKGVCTDKDKGAYFPAYDIRPYKRSGVEITIISNIYGSMRLQWRNISSDLFTEDGRKMKINGKTAFYKFKDLCLKHKIDLQDYMELDTDKAKQNKEAIEPPYIRFFDPLTEVDVIDTSLPNCHHIDYHSSYMTGLVNRYPEFKEVVEEIYAKRKSDNLYYKAILNMTQGYMQSDLCQLKWAHLSKAMIEDNNRRLDYLTECLIKSGRRVILYNTDGIWYQGELYHGPGEGDGIGTWHNDHEYCLLRIKSEGAYEFMEKGKYYPVVRGLTTLDRVKDRKKWVWGDIYKGSPIEFKFDSDTEKMYYEGRILGGKNYEDIMG